MEIASQYEGRIFVKFDLLALRRQTPEKCHSIHKITDVVDDRHYKGALLEDRRRWLG